MTGLRDLIADRCRAFATDGRAVAAVEFALILPLLLLLYLGSVETSRVLAYDRRLTSAASSLGDLVAQTRDTLALSELNDYFRAAELTFAPLDPTGLRLTVSCVLVTEDGSTEVIWSRPYNGGDVHSTGSSYPLPTEFTDIAQDDSYVIVAEAELNYTPLTEFVFKDGFDLRKEYYYVPRFGSEIAIDEDA